jgi:hypothetical protein
MFTIDSEGDYLPDYLPLGEVGRNSPWITHLGDAEVCRPGGVCMVPIVTRLVCIRAAMFVASCVPARVDMVKASAVPEVRPINGKLIVCVKLSFHGVVAGPWITGAAFQNEHSVVDSRTIERAECINLG